MGKAQRTKGAKGEVEFFKRLNQFLPPEMHIARNLGQARDSGADGSFDFAEIEVKRQESLRLVPWLKQAREAAGDEKTAILAYRQNRGDWKILVDMDVIELASYLKWRRSRYEMERELARERIKLR